MYCYLLYSVCCFVLLNTEFFIAKFLPKLHTLVLTNNRLTVIFCTLFVVLCCLSRDKVGVEVNDLYARILVAICSAESISQRIGKLRHEELQPQLVELIKGFMRNWQIITCWNYMKLKTKSCLK